MFIEVNEVKVNVNYFSNCQSGRNITCNSPFILT